MDYRIDYSPPKRHLDIGRSPGIQWNLSIPDEGMRGRSEYIFLYLNVTSSNVLYNDIFLLHFLQRNSLVPEPFVPSMTSGE